MVCTITAPRPSGESWGCSMAGSSAKAWRGMGVAVGSAAKDVPRPAAHNAAEQKMRLCAMCMKDSLEKRPGQSIGEGSSHSVYTPTQQEGGKDGVLPAALHSKCPGHLTPAARSPAPPPR